MEYFFSESDVKFFGLWKNDSSGVVNTAFYILGKCLFDKKNFLLSFSDNESQNNGYPATKFCHDLNTPFCDKVQKRTE